MAGAVEKYLKQLLEIHWLRPENAMWRTFDCLLMEKYANVAGTSVDLGCGDGTMSFVMAGGHIKDYDVFQDVGSVQEYNAGADVYNSRTEIVPDLDLASLRYRYEWGVDHKEGLIEKARRYAPFYRNTLVLDLNGELPFETGTFDSAFSNVLYWLEDTDRTLTGWHRILKKDGRLFLFVPNQTFKAKASLYYQAPHAGERAYLNYFDRGYGALIHHCYDGATWRGIFERNGFAVADHHSYLTNPVMELWNIGTRPLFPLLVGMANRLGKEEREQSKGEWIEYFAKFLLPLIEGEFERKVAEENTAFHFFVLEKK